MFTSLVRSKGRRKMGEAARRRGALTNAIPPVDIQQRVHWAVGRALLAFGAPGVADCVYHAAATAGALQAAGFIDARTVVGVAWWVVGPGAGDVITHGYDTKGNLLDLTQRRSGDICDAHAWASYTHNGTTIAVDMTTYQLHDKARRIAEVDGQPLTVTIPMQRYYWGPLPRQKSMWGARDGEWCFTQIPGLEKSFESPLLAELGSVAALAYQNPDAKLAVYDINSGKPADEAMEHIWRDFDGPCLVRPPR